MMHTLTMTMLLAFLSGQSLQTGEKPPYERLLKGDDEKQAAALVKQTEEWCSAGKFAEAIAPAEKLLVLRRRIQGVDHWQVADVARWLDTLQRFTRLPSPVQREVAEMAGLRAKVIDLAQAGRFAEAEQLLRKTLAVTQKVLGEDHVDTAVCCNDIAYLLDAQGKHAEAELLARQALTIRQKILGEEHPDTAQTYNNLACNLDAQSKFADAEPLHFRALAIRRKVLGEDHPDTASSYSNVSYNMWGQGKYAEAEPLDRRALAIRLKAQGEDDPETIRACSNLACNLDRQGKLADAEPLHRRALTLRAKVLGKDHPDTAASYNNVAYNLYAQGKYDDAEPLYRQALASWQKLLSEEHPSTALAYNNLAINLSAQGKYTEAEPLYRRALAIRQKVLGEDHEDTSLAYSTFGISLNTQGRYAEAEPLFRKALTIEQKSPGAEHRNTARTYNNLADNLSAQGRDADAEPLWQRSATAMEKARLRYGGSGFERSAAVQIQPHLGWAICLASLQRRTEAWRAAEAGLARGLLDDLVARALAPASPRQIQQGHNRARRLAELDGLLVPLLSAANLSKGDADRLTTLRTERQTLDDQIAREAAEEASRQVYPVESVQRRLRPDQALVFWLDPATPPRIADASGRHWACIVRSSGAPVWERLVGSGPSGTWTSQDYDLPNALRAALARPSGTWVSLARRLANQRVAPLERHLRATAGLPAVTHLIVVPVGPMAGVPVELLTADLLVSYIPSGTVWARLVEAHRPLSGVTLLALGDPTFKEAAQEKPEFDRLLASSRGSVPKPLPGTRQEVNALAALVPAGRARVLVGSQASEQVLDELAAGNRLKDFRLVHFATHGRIDAVSAGRSALLLANDQLPDEVEQARKGLKVYTGRLTAETMSKWNLDADLVTLSACETALGKQAGGEGLLGFSQVLFARGARGMVVSLWKVDDIATSLLMTRFYANLLGKGDELKTALPRAQALREAKEWLRHVSRSQRDELAASLSKGERGEVAKLDKPVLQAIPSSADEEMPYAHPYYWAAFVLLGDPE
jgi:CHAT domain-containing protein/tetratricopeptide (TPR) repeat protein